MDDEPYLVLDDDISRATIYPGLGASIGDYAVASGPLLKGGGEGRRGAFALGCQVLLPFANRISGGGFRQGERFHALSPNMAGETYPIHGNAAQSEWSVVSATSARAALQLTSTGPGDFCYQAELSYSLDQGSLVASLAVTNTANAAMPFGVGFHPWFVRTPDARLRFRADGYWTETAEYLPDGFVPLSAGAGLGGDVSAPLPGDWINAAFPGLSGPVELMWPERGSGVRLETTGLDVLMVYSPGAGADFVCVEPVSHTVDAHNRAGQGVVAPTVLAQGETLRASMTITPFAIV